MRETSNYHFAGEYLDCVPGLRPMNFLCFVASSISSLAFESGLFVVSIQVRKYEFAKAGSDRKRFKQGRGTMCVLTCIWLKEMESLKEGESQRQAGRDRVPMWVTENMQQTHPSQEAAKI